MTTTTVRPRRILRFLHLWLGLLGGVFIVAMALSGFVLVFRPVLDDRGPALASAPAKMDLAGVEHVLEAVHPGARISRIMFPQSASEPLLVQADAKDKTRLQLFFDPATGSILGAKQRRGWLEWIVDLHQNLFLGKTGRSLTGVIGAALLMLALTGVVSWLAGRRDWKRAFAVPRMTPWRQAAYPMHRWSGLWTNALLALVAFTGIVLAIPATFQDAIRAMTGESRPARAEMGKARGEKVKPRSVADYASAAVKAVPEGVIRELRMGGRRDGVSATMWTPGDLRPRGGVTLTFDAATANVLTIERSSHAPLSRKSIELANAIHKVELGGWLVRVPWSALGFVPLFLMVSGIQIWWTKRQANARRSEPAAEQEEALTAVTGLK